MGKHNLNGRFPGHGRSKLSYVLTYSMLTYSMCRRVNI